MALFVEGVFLFFKFRSILEITSTDFMFYKHVRNWRVVFMTSRNIESVENHI
jgi:hypothetical protein